MHTRGWFRLSCAASLTLAATVIASGADPVTWSYDIQTAGQDVTWASPTAVTPNAPVYDGTVTIDQVQVWVEYSGIPFGPIDVTDQIPPDQRMQQGQVDGPAPVVIADQHVVAPPPPDPVAFEADVRVELDADGFGHLSMTHIVLGTVQVDLGFPFGVVTADLTQIRVMGQVTVSPQLPGDLDGDDDVDLSDLAALLGNFGLTGVTPADGDLDADGDVDLTDLSTLLGNFGIQL